MGCLVFTSVGVISSVLQSITSNSNPSPERKVPISSQITNEMSQGGKGGEGGNGP